jgi:lysophospholipase III
VFTIDEMSEYLDDLRKLIIDTYETNNRQPVVLIAHSMGNLYVQYFLKYLDPQWKKTYIKSFIALSGPWGGAVKTIRLMTSGTVIVRTC